VLGVVGALMPLLGKRRPDRRALWPLTWLGATVVAFSLLPMKKNAYLLPAMPAQTLVVAAPIVSALRNRIPTRGDRMLLAAHAVAGVACLCVVLGVVLATPRMDLERPGPLLAPAAVGIFLLIGARSLSPRLVSMRTFALTSVAFALAVHGYESWVWPEMDNRRSDRAFAQSALAKAGDASLVVVGNGLREDVLFYLGRTLPVYRGAYRLPADYSGYAIVTADALEDLRDRGDDIAHSADRPAEQDRLVLMRFPQTAPMQSRESER
jgi:hypothetical protein